MNGNEKQLLRIDYQILDKNEFLLLFLLGKLVKKFKKNA
jgi:hypothetical protein